MFDYNLLWVSGIVQVGCTVNGLHRQSGCDWCARKTGKFWFL